LSGSVKIAFGQNMIGAIFPILVTVVTVPLVIRIIGPDRFGVLSIIWLLVGYFGLLDLGLSRATANKIAKLARDSVHTSAVFWSAGRCLYPLR
jgi:O-antigen/teichoic acid export membrane protein